MNRSHKIAILVSEIQNYITEEKFGGELLNAYLTNGFVGFQNMTDVELDTELDTLMDGEYSGWDENGLVVYERKGDEWIKRYAGRDAA